MQANEDRLRKLLDTTVQFIIPLFQRFYVWGEDAWKTLWNDLMELGEDTDPLRSHFIGSIVVIPTDTTPNLTKFILIDGQQRLATLLVLLIALRDQARHCNDPLLADEIEQTFLVNRFRNDLDRYKLLLSQQDRIAFQQLIHHATVDNQPVDNRLYQCYAFYKKRLEKLKADTLSLRNILSNLVERLSVVTITLDARDNPYLVFESLNFKGLKLTEADLIRNHLFMRIPSAEQAAFYNQYWLPMQDALGEDLTEYVRHFLMRTGSFIKQSEVYITLKKSLASNQETTAQAALQELALFATYYTRLRDPTCESHAALAEALKRLNRLEVTTVYPFLLNVYHDYSRRVLDATTFIKVIGLLENYLIRRFICGEPTNQLSKIFPSLYRYIQQQAADDFEMALRRILQTKNYPNDTVLRARLPTVTLYGKSGLERKAKFLLETLERNYHHKEPVTFEQLTVEHVMPQTLNDAWKTHLGEAWATVHDLYCNTLGNLTLTGDNSGLSNGTFADKRRRFATSHLELNRYFQTVESWRQADIEQRARLLTEHAIRCWPYFGDAMQSVTPNGDVTNTKPDAVTVLGTTKPAKSWRDVLIITLEQLAESQPTGFQMLPDRFPQLLARSGHTFRDPKRLNNGYYVETNLHAKAIFRYCQRIVEALELSPDTWSVTTKPNH